MGRHKKVKVVNPPVDSDPPTIPPTVPSASLPEPDVESKPKFKGDSITIRITRNNPAGPGVGFMRTFSRADHGEGFLEIANAFSKKFGGEYVE